MPASRGTPTARVTSGIIESATVEIPLASGARVAPPGVTPLAVLVEGAGRRSAPRLRSTRVPPADPDVQVRRGAIDAERMAKSKEAGGPLPTTHSNLFWRATEPTIRTGVKAMTAAVLELTKK
jgi:hypothetical protein